MKTLTKTILCVLSITFLIFILCACGGDKITEGEFSLSDYEDKIDNRIEWDLSEEKITTAQIALDAAKKVLNDPYRKDSVFDRVSWDVLYDDKEDVWLIRKHSKSKSSAIIIDSDGMLLTLTF